MLHSPTNNGNNGAIELESVDLSTATSQNPNTTLNNRSKSGSSRSSISPSSRTNSFKSGMLSADSRSSSPPPISLSPPASPEQSPSTKTIINNNATNSNSNNNSGNGTGLRLRKNPLHLGSHKHNQQTPIPNLSSHNYEPDESEVWRAFTQKRHFLNRGQWWTTTKRRDLRRWGVTLVIGVVQGLVAYACNVSTRYLSAVKFDHVYEVLQNEVSGKSSIGSAYFVFLSYQMGFVCLASLCVYLEPVAAGSGIPEIKCFLNGIAIPRIVRFRTLFCKVIGVTFSVSAGLPVGKEGPMIHSGGVVAAGISQGKSSLFGYDTSFTKISDFRNDSEKRDFVACGAAAGVCSAFGAPIGGVLFSLEEGCSYWSSKLTWRAFFCAMMTLLTLYSIKNLDTAWGQPNTEKLFSFGEFNNLVDGSVNYSIFELFLFILVGCLGGLIGAVFNAVNEHITLWRMKVVHKSEARKFAEVLCVTFLVSTVSFCMPAIWGRCTALPADMEDWTNQEKQLVDDLVAYKCDPSTEYNELASLYLTESDSAIKQLFHFREAGIDDSSTFSSAALFLFFLPYISLATVVYGISIPSGLFVPSLLSGAAFGRLCGHLLHKLDHTNGTFADSGSYALMGAAAVLGGMARMTISLTVILLEATGNMQYVLPLMLTLMAARFTGDVFNEGLYDIHINLKKIPFLQQEVPEIAEHHEIVAGQVMSTDVKCIRPVERVGILHDLLRSCEHGYFPIVDAKSGGTLYGTCSRSTLCSLLQHRAFSSLENVDDHNLSVTMGPRRLSPLVSWESIESVYPRYPTLEECDVKNEDRSCWIDLRPFANTAPYTINETASIQRTYRLFRTLGLRHLCVTNHSNQVVGIITRKDLLPESLLESLIRVRPVSDEEEESMIERGNGAIGGNVGALAVGNGMGNGGMGI